MAEDASECPSGCLSRSVSSSVPPSFFFQHFSSTTELISYLMLCVAKMPFIPPVSIARSGSGRAGKEKSIGDTSSALDNTKVEAGDKGSSVKERLASNLKQLGKKSQPRSHLPLMKGVPGSELHAKRRDRLLPSSHTDRSPASRSGDPKAQQHKRVSHSPVRSEPGGARARSRDREEVHFTLTLTPEAVLLLQRRNGERRHRSPARNAASGAGAPGSVTDSRRRRESVSRRHQPAAQRKSPLNNRAAAKNNSDTQPGDLSSILKISLLNEQHRYDDVEYEEEEVFGVDERVVLKCTEWLRGLENTPVTMGNSLGKSVSSVKSF